MYERKNTIDKKKLILALKISNLDKTIKKLKNGIETIIGVDSINFSGGEKQRIAIARAVYKFPDVLILDEFTSAIDDETKNVILKGLFSIFKRKNIIIITHDEKVANKCDQLYELNNSILKIKNNRWAYSKKLQYFIKLKKNTLKNKRILITGGTGFIGYHLAKRCLQLKWKVDSVSLKLPSKKRKLKNVKYICLDVSKKKKFNNKIN